MIIEMCFGKFTKSAHTSKKPDNNSVKPDVKNENMLSESIRKESQKNQYNIDDKKNPFYAEVSSIEHNSSVLDVFGKKRNQSNLSDLLKGSIVAKSKEKLYDQAIQTSFDKPNILAAKDDLMLIEEESSKKSSKISENGRLSYGTNCSKRIEGDQHSVLRSNQSVRSVKATTLNIRPKPLISVKSEIHMPLTHRKHPVSLSNSRADTDQIHVEYDNIYSARATYDVNENKDSIIYQLNESESSGRKYNSENGINNFHAIKYDNIHDVIRSLQVSKVPSSELISHKSVNKSNKKFESINSLSSSSLMTNVHEPFKFKEVVNLNFAINKVEEFNYPKTPSAKVLSFDEYNRLNVFKYDAFKTNKKNGGSIAELKDNKSSNIIAAKDNRHFDIPKLDFGKIEKSVENEVNPTVKRRSKSNDSSMVHGLSTFILDMKSCNSKCGYGVIICDANNMKLTLIGNEIKALIALYFPDLAKSNSCVGKANESIASRIVLYLFVLSNREIYYYRLQLHARNRFNILSSVLKFSDLDFDIKNLDTTLRNLYLHDDVRKIYACVMRVVGGDSYIKNYDIRVSSANDACIESDFYLVICRDLHIVFAKVNMKMIDDYVKNCNINRNIIDFCNKIKNTLSSKDHVYDYKFASCVVTSKNEMPSMVDNLFAIVFTDSGACVSSFGIYEYESIDNLMNGIDDVNVYEIELKRELFDSCKYERDVYRALYDHAYLIYNVISNGKITTSNVKIDYIVLLNEFNIYYANIRKDKNKIGSLFNVTNRHIQQALNKYSVIDSDAINTCIIACMRDHYKRHIGFEILSGDVNCAVFTIEPLKDTDCLNVIAVDKLLISFKDYKLKDNVIQIYKNERLREWILKNIKKI